jgi:hypothetical protein
MEQEFTLNNPYMDKNIIKYYTNATITKKYSTTYCNIIFKCITKNELPQESVIKNILNYIPKINNNKFFNIFIILYKGKRKLSNPSQKKYINGGFTYLNGNNIYIYRKQEFIKVLFHEILHHSINVEYYTIYYKNKYLLSEAVTEFLATIHYLKFLKLFKQKYIQIELEHSINIIPYILNIDDHNTNIYEYIVMKYILLLNHTLSLKSIHKPSKIIQILDNFNIHSIKNLPLTRPFNFSFMFHTH